MALVPVLPLLVPGRHDPPEDQRPLLATAGLGHGLQEGVAHGDGVPPAVLVHLGLGDGTLGIQEELQGLSRPRPGRVVGGGTALARSSAISQQIFVLRHFHGIFMPQREFPFQYMPTSNL